MKLFHLGTGILVLSVYLEENLPFEKFEIGERFFTHIETQPKLSSSQQIRAPPVHRDFNPDV
jgi:hypothetical protein